MSDRACIGEHEAGNDLSLAGTTLFSHTMHKVSSQSAQNYIGKQDQDPLL